jgi:hypothetical protein
MQQYNSDFAKGFLLLQVIIGYEWFASGLTKLAHGDFPAGLSADLHERAKEAAPWYRHFLNSVVMPHASSFGYAIELAELLSGVVLIGAAVIFLVRRERIGRPLGLWLAALTALAALTGLLLAVNFVLANRVGFSPVAPDSFDEGISLDALLVGVQVVLLGVALAPLARLRLGHTERQVEVRKALT